MKNSCKTTLLLQFYKYLPLILEIRNDETYVRWLTRTYIMGGKPQNAWDTYINMDTSNESFSLL